MLETIQNFSLNPETTNIFGFFLFIGALLCLFGVWYEGKKDGFDEEKLFDLFLLSFFGALVFGKISQFLLDPVEIKKIGDVVAFIFSAKINYLTTIAVFTYIVVALAKKWKWSAFRVLDIFALGLSFLASIVALGYVVYTQQPKYLFIFTLYILFYSIFSTLRNHTIKSGMAFSSFCIFSVVILYFVFGNALLPIYLLLSILGVVVIVSRFKKTMSTHLTLDFIEKMKQKLVAKDKELAKEEETIKASDPYLTYEDRESDNAETVDDAMEDMMHESQQMSLNIVQKARAQIQKALDKISGGTYGISDVSGKPIPQERLEAYPEATTLVNEQSPESDENQ